MKEIKYKISDFVNFLEETGVKVTVNKKPNLETLERIKNLINKKNDTIKRLSNRLSKKRLL